MSGSNSSAHASAPDALPEPLTMTVHSVAAPTLADEDARVRTRRGRLRMLLVLLACAAPVIASYLTYFVIRPSGGSTAYGTLILPTRTLPELALADLDGRAVPARSLRGQWLLVAVGPAACDAACEQRLFMQRQLREMLGRERDRLDKVWLITDAAPLAAPLQAALTAAPPVTLLRADAAAVAAWLAPEPGHTLEQHLYIVDPMGEWMMRVPADPEPGRVKRDLERLLRASASWDRAGR
ncbi:MAG: hypothetical protein KF683_03165 [Rubrivivax sp.]|nr:hypothetical protein [Rubrivivax sp.]